MDLKDIARSLSECYGPPAWEEEVVGRILEHLADLEVQSWRDGIGNLFVKVKEGSGPRVVLVAHMDEVSMIVRYVDERGFLYVQPLGGVDPRVLLGQRVIVHGRRRLEGCIGSKPPHLTTQEEQKQPINFKDLYVDVGASSREEVLREGVRVGSYVTFPSCFAELMGSRIMGKSFDDRLGCAASIEVLRRCLDRGTDTELYTVFTVQEELGLRGASTIVNQLDPDLAIVLECTVAGDVPFTSPQDYVTTLSNGAAVRVMDASMLVRRALIDKVVEVAESCGVRYQLQIMSGGGTDAGRIHTQGKGVPTIVVATPCRYLHSPNLVADLTDLYSVVELSINLVERSRELIKTAL